MNIFNEIKKYFSKKQPYYLQPIQSLDNITIDFRIDVNINRKMFDYLMTDKIGIKILDKIQKDINELIKKELHDKLDNKTIEQLEAECILEKITE